MKRAPDVPGTNQLAVHDYTHKIIKKESLGDKNNQCSDLTSMKSSSDSIVIDFARTTNHCHCPFGTFIRISCPCKYNYQIF